MTAAIVDEDHLLVVTVDDHQIHAPFGGRSIVASRRSIVALGHVQLRPCPGAFKVGKNQIVLFFHLLSYPEKPGRFPSSSVNELLS